jgi:hypothetical protein
VTELKKQLLTLKAENEKQLLSLKAENQKQLLSLKAENEHLGRHLRCIGGSALDVTLVMCDHGVPGMQFRPRPDQEQLLVIGRHLKLEEIKSPKGKHRMIASCGICETKNKVSDIVHGGRMKTHAVTSALELTNIIEGLAEKYKRPKW